MLYSGVDLHRRLIVICTVNESGSIVARKSMKTQPDLVTAYFRQWPDQHRPVGIGSLIFYAHSASTWSWPMQST
jgi:predicted NBD/HSP70 family sugar kinase